VAGPANLSIYYDRLQGYLDALKEAGIASAFQMIIPDTLTREKSFTIFSNILAGTSRPDAVFAASDFSALGALLAARDLKLSIPQDFGIAGFANEPFTEFVQPGLTTTDQNAEEMGRKVASLYLDNLDNPDVRHEIIKPKLMVRGSTLREN
jgi:LacI family transcriptional regulator